MKVFEYCILLHPTEEEEKNGVPTRLIVPITSVLAKDTNQAGLMAGRAIPEEHLDKLDRMEVAVRPF